jgi:hypothetical protein
MNGAMEDDKFNYRALNSQEVADKERLITSVGNIAASLGTNLSDNGNRSDISILGEVLTHLNWGEHGEVCFIAVGLAFGALLAASEPLDWVKVQDEWCEEISLKLRTHKYFIHPVSMIVKRAERGEEIDLQYLFDEMIRRVRDDGPLQMPTPN